MLPLKCYAETFYQLAGPSRRYPYRYKVFNLVTRKLYKRHWQAEQTWFTLAAYNAGYGHMLDARRLAAELKLDPDRWFGNVEQAMLLLSKPKYYKRTRYWICARWATGHLRSRNKATLCRLCTRSGAIICSHPTMFL